MSHPAGENKSHDPYEILYRVLDGESLFEFSSHFGKSKIIRFARLNGCPVGATRNNPRHLGGSMDVSAGLKVIRFMKVCNTFHLPMVCFVDEPGFMVGMLQGIKDNVFSFR